MTKTILIKRFEQCDYQETLLKMEQTVQSILDQNEPEQIWFLEHHSVYTRGSSAKDNDLLSPLFPVVETNRGGQFTYHGPGQLVGYIMIHLQHQDIRRHIQNLAQALIDTLRTFDIAAYYDPEHVGLWVRTQAGPKKIAAFGLRIKKWVTWHGFSLNISPDLSHFQGIVPCGIKDYGVTSMQELGIIQERKIIEEKFASFFFPTIQRESALQEGTFPLLQK